MWSIAQFRCSPNDVNGWTCTCAPIARAISPVRSLEPESTTWTSSHHAHDRRQSARFGSSLYVRITTDTGGSPAPAASAVVWSFGAVPTSIVIPDPELRLRDTTHRRATRPLGRARV